jgi:hypothetical protein
MAERCNNGSLFMASLVAVNAETEFTMMRPNRYASNLPTFPRSQLRRRDPHKICECGYQIWLVKVIPSCATLLTTPCWAGEAEREIAILNFGAVQRRRKRGQPSRLLHGLRKIVSRSDK